MPEKGDNRRASAYSEVFSAFSSHLGGVHDLASITPDDFHSLRLVRRGADDVLAVLKRYGAAGDVEVTFGSGVDLVTALLAVSAAASSGRWRVDRPYSGSKA